MKKLAIVFAVGAAALLGGSAANAKDNTVNARAATDVTQTDFSSHRRHWRHRHHRIHRHHVYRHHVYRSYRPYHRTYGYVPQAYYAPQPYYYGGGAPIISLGFGGGGFGFGGGGWGHRHHHHRHW